MNKYRKKLNKIKNEPMLILRFFISKGFMNYLSDKYFLMLMYYACFKRKLSLENPQSYNEKLQWLKLYDRRPIYTNLVDKFEVRKYIKELLGEDYLIPLIGVWDDFDEIKFDELPNQFVLKCTHDSGGVVICKDKLEFDIESARKILNKSLSKNYYKKFREWPYKNIKPKIICEKYLEENSGELRDYKLMVFNGEVKCTLVASNRNSGKGLSIDFYDIEWKRMPFGRANHQMSDEVIAKPLNYQKMILFAEKLSESIPFVRVDFYENKGDLYFGEMTFYPASGFESFEPESYDLVLGNWLSLPIDENKN